LAGKEQHCIKSTNHLHHEDGSFQEYIALDAGYLALLPDDIDPVVTGPVLCAGLTTYKVSYKLARSACACLPSINTMIE
jgi:D-arabinose 1-dehydrogenase-like Zn-dependent alcohol dehydrogenase